MAYEDWWNFFQLTGVVLVALTFTIGAFAFFTGYKTRQEKDKKAQEQRERIEELRNNTAQLEKEVAEAKTKQAEAERALLELQEKLRRRRLTEAQKTNLQNHLRNAPKGAIEILSDNNIEAKEYANDWAEVMKGAAWIVNGGGVSVAVTPLQIVNNLDIIIQIRRETPQAIALQQALISEGIDIPFFANPERENDRIVLVVATKR